MIARAVNDRPYTAMCFCVWLFRQVCRGRIYASRAVCPLGCVIGMVAAGGIYAAPTNQIIMFIIIYGRGRGIPRPYGVVNI